MDITVDEPPLPPPPPPPPCIAIDNTPRDKNPSTIINSSSGWQQFGPGEDVDVTALCREAAAMLGPDEMIYDADFNLYSAMSALELMDAKMDKAPPALQVSAL